MEKNNVNSQNFEEMSFEEYSRIIGGKTVICHYDGGNKLFYAINAAANAVKWVKHWITGDDLYVSTIHDNGTRDEPVPYV